MRLGALLEKIRMALQTPLCRACGVDIRLDEMFCDRCRQTLGLRQARPLTRTSAFRAHAATTLTPAVKKHLYGYKFYRRRDALPLLADLLIHYWRQWPEEPSTIGHSTPI